MAMTAQERSAKARQKRIDRGETILRLPVLDCTRQQLAELMAWSGVTEQAEAVTLLIKTAHKAGRERSAEFIEVPRHEIEVGESVARNVFNAGARESARLDSQDED